MNICNSFAVPFLSVIVEYKLIIEKLIVPVMIFAVNILVVFKISKQ